MRSPAERNAAHRASLVWVGLRECKMAEIVICSALSSILVVSGLRPDSSLQILSSAYASTTARGCWLTQLVVDSGHALRAHSPHPTCCRPSGMQPEDTGLHRYTLV